MRGKVFYTVVIATVATLLMVSCESGDRDERGLASPAEQNLSAEDFTGPYAAQFYSIYQNARLQIVADMAASGNITQQDMTDINNLYTSCMLRYGYDARFDSDFRETKRYANGELINDGNVEEFGRDSSEKEMLCYKETSMHDIQQLFRALQTNPNNEDLVPAFVRCFVKKNLAPAGYTVDEYNYDSGQVDGKEHGWIDKLWNQNNTAKTSQELNASAANEQSNELMMAQYAQCQNDPFELLPHQN